MKYYNQNQPCYICGLPIPERIVHNKQDLFGTIDHVLPKRAGGPDSWWNRAPAHYICNHIKGHNFPVTISIAKSSQNRVMQAFSALPSLPKGLHLKAQEKLEEYLTSK